MQRFTSLSLSKKITLIQSLSLSNLTCRLFCEVCTDFKVAFNEVQFQIRSGDFVDCLSCSSAWVMMCKQ